ncbi:MAG: hypothetical protein HN948_06265 [Clostridia bacterium]|jgi:uncharacterized membrane protein|nr:hypothetical protein [Clostridia bacterium]MBT7122601.1 hypothetical protein [Clostridia bacterium]
MSIFDRQSKKQTEIINRKNPAFWKFEVFYYNKEDRSAIVGSRFGVGFAFNYAHTAVKIGLVLLAAAIIALVVLVVVL